MNKLRKKGKLKLYKEIKQEMLSEVRQADALGVDLTKASSYNNLVIKEILAIYFTILHGQSGAGMRGVEKSSPLLRSVFLGLPQFTQFVNMEIVWDLIGVVREFLLFELELNPKSSKQCSIKNVLSGLLCSFQIIEIGAGSSFNVEEKDFINCLYQVTQRIVEEPFNYDFQDFITFLKCSHLVFVVKRQLSNEMVAAFAKKLLIMQAFLPTIQQAGVLLLLKQMLQKYPHARSNLVDLDDDAVGGGYGNNNILYRGDLNDPSLANVQQTNGIFEMLFCLNQHKSNQ
eukprot:CAMPEP_0168614820 /NCGR_PEP_ID=MMETSP0449_2-20121227/4181_1 /TAXON_ID=1082188 /ORGANISM="Strombidium rassoulzadegani, Strain ras09" /LENGTH=285 /DNA_ID=CAMNT_0008655531 /DNA_START=895 /DNA_END=1752 /DNA_ORIENTATION=-